MWGVRIIVGTCLCVVKFRFYTTPQLLHVKNIFLRGVKDVTMESHLVFLNIFITVIPNCKKYMYLVRKYYVL